MINPKVRRAKVAKIVRKDSQFLGPTVKERMAAGKALRENTPRTSHAGHYKATRILTLTANGIITIAMIASLILLVRGIPQHLETPKALLPERTLDHQYSGIRTLVLEARCRRSAEARPSGRPLK